MANLPILDNKNIVIFGYPRAGTKLIAGILTGFGYHNYGEYFDTWSSKLVDGVPVRVPELQEKFMRQYSARPNIINYQDTIELLTRLPKWKPTYDKWTVTLWYENIAICPILFSVLKDCLWICPRRNPWDQYLSRLLVLYNQNPDGEKPSNPITVEEKIAHIHFWKMHKVTLMQNWIIRNMLGVELQFADLIKSRYPGFGQDYTISTTDQHKSLEDLIINIEELKQWYAELDIQRKEIRGKDYSI